MPRKADAGLEGRILDAAYELWSKRGESALTMRAVARAAKTTTPTVYQRFRDKRDLLELLRGRALQNLLRAIEPARSSAETCRRFLGFASTHPNEYRLLTADWAVRLSRKEPKPSFELIKKRLAADLGGSPGQHARLALALGALVHGTATMLLVEGVHEGTARELRSACFAACEALIEHASPKSGRQKAFSSAGAHS
ncbi:MAG: helix-turn-helix domain-containing protein [Candidatus Acidiferrales bacterium]